MSETIFMGGGGKDYAVHQGLLLKYANRHGLVAGATGTGKTVTLQIMAEGFASAGVPVFLSDVKGDLSGIARAGSEALSCTMPSPSAPERSALRTTPMRPSQLRFGIFSGNKAIRFAQPSAKWARFYCRACWN